MQALTEKLNADRMRQWMPLVTLVLLVGLVGVFQPGFLEVSTLLQLASDTAVLFVLATGVTFVIMIGGIDLSIQSMASLASVIVALTVSRLGYGVGLALGKRLATEEDDRRALPRTDIACCISRRFQLLVSVAAPTACRASTSARA